MRDCPERMGQCRPWGRVIMKMRKFFAGLAALVVAATGFINAPAAHADTDVYGTPGVHNVNGRYWKTACSMYSSAVARCTTDIFGTKVFAENGRWYKQNTWVFNNLSYLPSSRAQWDGNPLATTGSWTSADGRQWRSECDTSATGRGACRNYIVADVASESGGWVKMQTIEVFNSMVRFSTSTLPAVTEIPPAAPYITPPVDGAKLPLRVAASPKPAPIVTVPAPGKSVPGIGWDCPSTHPIKGNAASMIYHLPRQRYYNNTKPEECFAKEAHAVAAGYRKAKV